MFAALLGGKRLNMLKERHQIFVTMLAVSDAVVLAGAHAAGIAIGHAVAPMELRLQDDHLALKAGGIGIPIFMAAMVVIGMYRAHRDRRFMGEFQEIVKACFLGWGALIVALHFLSVDFFLQGNASLQLLWTAVAAILFLSIHRLLFRRILHTIRARGWNLRHVAVIGTGRLGQIACHTFSRNSWTGINCAYFISHRDTTGRTDCLNRPVFSGLDDLETTLENHDVDGVVIALPQSRSYLLPNLLMRLERFPLEVRIIPDLNPKYMPMNLDVSTLEGMPVLSIRQYPLRGYGAAFKRGVDLGVGVAALAFFGLPMLVFAAIIRLSDNGPVIFRQVRVSMAGKTFVIYKFRTMVVNADQHSQERSRRGADAWTQKDDARITPFGKWLRKFSLDELPQLFNVIRGDMSLVGPRPERLDLLNDFREDWRGYMLRQNIKAGMTGWAQINGLRGNTSLRKRLQYDLYYVRNWSILFDLRILFLTIFRGFRHPNAH